MDSRTLRPRDRRYPYPLSRALIGSLLLCTQATGAAEPGNTPAEELRQKGEALEYGQGIAADLASARALYCRAAQSGDGPAAYNLGWMHLNGRGVPGNDAIAVGWFRLAATLGDGHAERLLDRLDGIEAAEDPDCLVLSTHPHRKAVETWVHMQAPGHALDPELVMAVIEAESNFNPKAKSPKNAKGLMQLMDSTARRFGVTDIWSPRENLTGGMRYLSWLIRRFDGDLRLALAGYNAGERRVDEHGGVPPFRETRDYVKRIIERYGKDTHPVPPDLAGADAD
ncbi:MAG: lytic transglycosylase domain-containing protein [Gammaproteobacteria bacterium]